MLEFFVVSRTFHNVVARASVERKAGEKVKADITITVDRRIVRMEDESNASFRSISQYDLGRPETWDSILGTIARDVYENNRLRPVAGM